MNSMPVTLYGQNGTLVYVSPEGVIATGARRHSQQRFVELAEPDTAYNFILPQAKKQFVVTGMFAKADKQVSSTVDATVIVYEGLTSDTITVTRTIFQIAMVEGDIFPMGDLDLLINQGRYINAKTDDDDIHLNVMGYFIDDTGEVLDDD